MLLAKLSSRWSHAPGERQNHPDLGYVVQLQKCDVLLAGSEEMVRSTLRVTMVFRREDGTWRVPHRHADPITTPQPINTIVDT
jgi:ketosteroid isomerase-like protein